MSFKGKLFHYALKNRHILKGKLKAEIIDKDTCIEKLRYEIAKIVIDPNFPKEHLPPWEYRIQSIEMDF